MIATCATTHSLKTALVSNPRYRAEIDGLRAIAVMAVVLFHAGLGVSGGYIGVDVFFVISGFLITSLIIKDQESGSFGLAKFWERRARRILPAMIVVVLVTLIAGWFILLPSDYASLGCSTVWQAVFGANIHYWLNTGYFAGAAKEDALLHTWSLAVEEQFYMVVPLLLVGLFQFPVFRRRGILMSLFGAGILISLIASIYGVARHPSAAFYLLPARAWELLCGALVALVPEGWLPKPTMLREGLALFGLTGILLPCWIYTKTTPFPGLAAVPPCFGTALFILASGQPSTAVNLPMSARLLASRPVVFVGLISYSLYLWHWPLFAFGNYLAFQPLSLAFRLSLVVLGFGIATLSWRYVETPFRKRRLCARRLEMFSAGALGIAVVLAMGGLVMLGHGFPIRVPAKAIQYASAKDDNWGIHDLNAQDINAGLLVPLGSPDPAAPVDLLLWGDSHAMAAASAFDQFLKENGLAGRQATASATAPVLGAFWRSEFTNPKDVMAFNDAVFDYIKQHHVHNVVLVGYWQYYTDGRGTVPLQSALLSTIRRLIEVGTQPYLMLDVPHQQFDVPKTLALANVFGCDISSLLIQPSTWNGVSGYGDSFIRQMEVAGCHVLDPRPCFLDQAQQHYVVEKNGIALYRDNSHLSASGAKMILLPFFRDTLKLRDVPGIRASRAIRHSIAPFRMRHFRASKVLFSKNENPSPSTR